MTFPDQPLLYLDIGGQGPGLMPAAEAAVPAADRGLLYGDGLFETVLLQDGRLPLLDLHLARLAASAAALGIPCDPQRVRTGASALASAAPGAEGEQALRITLTRGSGPARGYAPPASPHPTLLITLSSYRRPAGPLRAIASSIRIWSGSPLWQHKTLSALEKVMARAEAARAGVDEALLLNEHGRLAEGAAANLFIYRDGRWLTPPISEGCLPGIMRRRMITLTGALESPIEPADLSAADGLYLTSALMGCLPVASVDGAPVRLGPAPPSLADLLSP